MSLIPSIRVDCSQCKKAFWVKLKKGTIPSVIVACPNCAYAWDLGQHTSDTIVQRSYRWDELITQIGSFLTRTPKIPVTAPDESVEQFKEANTSSDSMEDWRPDLIELQVEPLEDEPEVIAYSGQEVSEELGVAPSEASKTEVPVRDLPEAVAEPEPNPEPESGTVPEEEVFEDLEDEFEDMEIDEPTLKSFPQPSMPPPLGTSPPKLALPKLTPLSFQKTQAPTNGKEDDKSS
jgi:hypothetical protein